MINQPAITKIKHHTKMQAKPLYWISDDQLVFYIHLESTQNSDSINRNPVTNILLEMNQNTVIEPSEWIEKKKTAYQLEGTLHFSIHDTPKTIVLSWFDLTEVQFKWDISPSTVNPLKKE